MQKKVHDNSYKNTVSNSLHIPSEIMYNGLWF